MTNLGTLAIAMTGMILLASPVNASTTPGPMNAAGDVMQPSDPLDTPVTGQAAVADLDQWLEWTKSTHPELAYSTDIDVLEAKTGVARDELMRAKTARDVWAAMAMLNPVLDDAHAGLRLPEAQFEDWIKRGGIPFPAAVTVEGGRAFLSATDEEIITINDISMGEALEWLIPRLRGEDRKLQERIASLRFALALWTYAGGAEQYAVKLRLSDGSIEERVLEAAQTTSEPAEAQQSFRLATHGDFAFLTVDTFNIAKREEFAAFLPDAFERIAQARSQRLVIDLRENGGGAHDVSDLLMAYFTSEPHSPISAITARIVPENQRLIPTSTLGDVVKVPFMQTVEPPEQLEHRFGGDIWILIGPKTYSQAIVFATTALDHGLARLAGAPTSGRANQTGQVQRTTLNNTGFIVQSPIYIFTRWSGDRSSAVLEPELTLQKPETSDHVQIAQRINRFAK